MAAPNEFARNLRRIGQQIVERSERLPRLVALAILAEVVISTPVDTGRARGNWLVGIGSPETNGDAEQEARADRSGQRTIAEGTARIEASPARTTIFLSNSVPYIGRLNDGSSAQAPAGFVQDAVRAGIEVVRRTRLLDR